MFCDERQSASQHEFVVDGVDHDVATGRPSSNDFYRVLSEVFAVIYENVRLITTTTRTEPAVKDQE